MKISLFYLFVATLCMLATCHGKNDKIFPLLMKSSDYNVPNDVSCSSWRLGVETHNIKDWVAIPFDCLTYVGNYLLEGDQYRSDSKTVNREGYLYAKTLKLKGDGKDIWVFDIDETSISNIEYFASIGFRIDQYNETTYINEWVNLGIAPALPETLKLYRKLLSLGIKIVFLTGRTLDQKHITIKNLIRAGYTQWERLICKEDVSETALSYKSNERKKLEEEGYRIIGNIGDQWSDILGTNIGNRTFKLPNPLYYVE